MDQHLNTEITHSPNPLHQFEVHPIVPLKMMGFDISITNATVFMLASVFVTLALLMLASRRMRLVPGRGQAFAEQVYGFLDNLIIDNVGPEGKRFFPLIFTLFLFVLSANMMGMIPYAYTTTSQLIVTFSLALIVFLGSTLVGIYVHGFGFVRMFIPEGVPLPLLILVVPIEIMSYCIRPISLSVRLFANMMAGHTMLKVFAGFAVGAGLLGLAPVGFNVILTGFELFVALLQAYIFTVLTCLYFHNALHLH